MISKFTFTQTKGDKVQWQVQAQQARLFEQDKKAMLDNVAVTLFGGPRQRIDGPRRRGHVEYGDKELSARQSLRTAGDPHPKWLHHLYQPSGLD